MGDVCARFNVPCYCGEASDLRCSCSGAITGAITAVRRPPVAAGRPAEQQGAAARWRAGGAVGAHGCACCQGVIGDTVADICPAQPRGAGVSASALGSCRAACSRHRRGQSPCHHAHGPHPPAPCPLRRARACVGSPWPLQRGPLAAGRPRSSSRRALQPCACMQAPTWTSRTPRATRRCTWRRAICTWTSSTRSSPPAPT